VERYITARPARRCGGLIVAAILAIGFLLLFVGLAVVVLILAHSSWHLYPKVVEPAGPG